jgi:hypothetical protein
LGTPVASAAVALYAIPLHLPFEEPLGIIVDLDHGALQLLYHEAMGSIIERSSWTGNCVTTRSVSAALRIAV